VSFAKPIVAALLACIVTHGQAHHVLTAGAPAAPAPNAPTVSLPGFVTRMTVDNKVTRTTSNVTVFHAEDGSRHVLLGAAAADLAPGASYVVTGRGNGRALFVDSARVTSTQNFRSQQFANAPVVTVDGTLRLGHADNFDGAPSEFFYAIVGGGEQLFVSNATLVDGLQNGMLGSVSGRVAADGELVADQVVIVAPGGLMPRVSPDDAPLTTSYIVIPVKFPTNPAAPWTYNADPFSIASLNTSVFGATGSVQRYYDEVSFGQQLISGIVADNGSAGWLLAERALPATCDINVIATAAENAATARGYNLASYAGRIYVFTNNVPGCGWAGLAYVGWPRSYIKQTTSVLVIGHEVGHNFGMLHAGNVDCGTNVIGGTCTFSEYGDPFGIMGNNRSMHANAAQKFDMGWIAPGTVRTHRSGRATYTLSPIESAGGATYAVKIPAAANRTYWLEYRQPIGFDAGLASFPNNGAQVRVSSPFESVCSGCDTEFLDMTPGTASFTDGTLVVGQSYIDANYAVKVDVTSATPTALTLDIVALGPVRLPDFDASATSDLLWTSSATGGTSLWLMNGGVSTGNSTLSSNGDWTVSDLADFSGEGKSDLLWRSSSGATAMWLMNGAAPSSTAVLSGDPAWTVRHVADFNGDGKSDLVWRSASGVTAIWLMNGTANTSSAIVSGNAAWTATHTGDFNGDGKADIVWRSSAGATAIWLMNGVAATQTRVVSSDPAWQIVRVADLDGDGKDDLVWRHTGGGTVAWLMNGTTSTASGGIFANAALQVEFAGDFDGDGKADLVVRDTASGSTSLYFMNGAMVASTAAMAVPSSMRVTGLGDYNGDGRADIVWRDTATGATSVWLMNGATPLATQVWSTIPSWSVLLP
jgi:hypothetical protein